MLRRNLCVVFLAGFLAACTGGGAPEPSPTTPASTVPASPQPSEEPSGEPTAGPTGEPSTSPVLEDGRYFGYIRSVDVDAGTLRFDLAYLLTGDAANEAAAEHGDPTPVPNDYYIVNDNPRLRTLPISPDLEVWVIDWTRCCDLVRGEAQPFLEAFSTRHHAWDALYQGRQAPYWITLEGGAVAKVEVQYFP